MNKFILFFWDYFPPSRNLIRKCLYSTADTINNLGERVGQMYNDLFSRIGTSWYDHSFDHLRGISNYHWMERVFFTLDKIKKEDEVLDIGCGDGSFDSLFYADKARSIVAIDKDPKAISYAKKHYQRSNVKYITCDITKMKNTNNRYDIILMFAVIEPAKVAFPVVCDNTKASALAPTSNLISSNPVSPIVKSSPAST